MKLVPKIAASALFLALIQVGPVHANQTERITNLEKRVTALEKELNRLREQEKRASKYLKCVQNVEGNALTVPFKILNCIRK